ncbi:haloacid dehalogenase-like hydrolase [Sphingobium nicotianae]|uniref:Haloacid dehalogenase-like hydrolase n=1 Tax=Sphingobium nicotianae TaxID=2782607 RepID=A0A9X1ITB7_9SPHN|nr:haloacid dehalogenase-like hydrolase [Sphingobium nicotianae]MBT2189165.1 haloacid dehalogenase-like hydrolase [Sphingobium nicotianae]
MQDGSETGQADPASAADGDPARSVREVPLCVDLDGTLTLTDLLHEGAVRYFKSSPFAIFHMLFWLLRGKAHLKRMLAEHAVMRGDLLPYRANLVAFLEEERGRQREIHLVTASPQAWADMVAGHLGLFDGVIGTTAENLKGSRKAAMLVERYGHQGYDYVGDHPADLTVWKTARTAHSPGRAGAAWPRKRPAPRRARCSTAA